VPRVTDRAISDRLDRTASPGSLPHTTMKTDDACRPVGGRVPRHTHVATVRRVTRAACRRPSSPPSVHADSPPCFTMRYREPSRTSAGVWPTTAARSPTVVGLETVRAGTVGLAHRTRHRDRQAQEGSTATGETGVDDVSFDLISVLYHSLKAGHDYGQYVLDAEDAGHQEIAEFFGEVRAQDSSRASRFHDSSSSSASPVRARASPDRDFGLTVRGEFQRTGPRKLTS